MLIIPLVGQSAAELARQQVNAYRQALVESFTAAFNFLPWALIMCAVAASLAYALYTYRIRLRPNESQRKAAGQLANAQQGNKK